MKNKLLDKMKNSSKKNINGWTPERKIKQAELIRQWQPWEHSTGAKTAEGKIKVSQNAYKGSYWKELRELKKQTNETLREQSEWLNEL
ncbi:MAG: hypothetical protein ACRCWR_04955 [Saezia sp.]